METYRFLGAESHIDNVKLSRFGQRFSIPEEVAEIAQRGGCAIILESDYEGFFPDPNLVKIYGSPFMNDFSIPSDPKQAKEKEVFLEQKAAALAHFREIHFSLLGEDAPRVDAGEPEEAEEKITEVGN